MSLSSACSYMKNWNWKKGDSYKDDTAGVIFERNYFDCGTYFFDGVFNCVSFPKGMMIYHGSSLLADKVVEFPVGIDYYKDFDIADNKKNIPVNLNRLSVAYTLDESLEEIISTMIPITAGWYANPSTAQIYSGYSGTGTQADKNCGRKCINAYKLDKDVIFVLLDDYNISKLLHSRDVIVPVHIKKSLMNMFQLKTKTPSKTNSDEPFNRLKYAKNRISSRAFDKPFASWFCGSDLLSQYAGFASTMQYSSYHSINSKSRNKFHLEFIFCNAFKYLSRDLTNPLDWMYFNFNLNPIPLYLNELLKYETTNVNFHSGNLFEHSVWSLLFTEDLLHRGLLKQDRIEKLTN